MMYEYLNFTTVLWLTAVFCGLHLLSASISDRILNRSNWVRFTLEDSHDGTEDTGPK
jgi:hypothetical protein